jgi:AraC-like DNA-binding protein
LPRTLPIHMGYRLNHPIHSVFHSHDQYEIYYFHEGKCNYLIGDRIYVLEPGDLILMDGMTLHCPKIEKGAKYVRSFIHFDGPHWKTLLGRMQLDHVLQPFVRLRNYRLSLRNETKREFEAMLEDLNKRCACGDDVNRDRTMLAFMDLLVYIYGLCLQPLEDQPVLPSRKESTVQRIITFVEEHYTEDLDLDRLEAGLHLSKYYLSKVFKEVTGVTIFAYLYQRRINQAKVLFLMDEDRNVTEVAFQLGFNHASHFSRLFKKQVGCTPEQYRKTLRSQKTPITI